MYVCKIDSKGKELTNSNSDGAKGMIEKIVNTLKEKQMLGKGDDELPRKLEYYSPALPIEWKKMLSKILEKPAIKHEIRLRGWTLSETSVVKLAVWKLLEEYRQIE